VQIVRRCWTAPQWLNTAASCIVNLVILEILAPLVMVMGLVQEHCLQRKKMVSCVMLSLLPINTVVVTDSSNVPTARRVTAVDRSGGGGGYTGWSGDGKQYVPQRKEINTNPNACGKCGKAVYMAEEILAAGKKWHKMCFKCTNCKKLLDSSTMASHDGDLYCKSCHTRKFGTTGYGYGIGAGTLSSEKGVSQGVYQIY